MRETLQSLIQDIDLIKIISVTATSIIGPILIRVCCLPLRIKKHIISEKVEIAKKEEELIKADNDKLRALIEQAKLIKTLQKNVPKNGEKS